MGVACCNGGGAARCGMSNDSAGQIDTWLARCADIERDPFEGMAEAGLLALAPDYATIARTKAALVERTGLAGVAGVWGGRQMVGRWFVAGFGNASQRSAWLGRAASVAISEPRVGAHPKLLTTRAEVNGDAFVITGEKAWVSNGPSAEVFIVLAITGEQDGRKRYSAFLVPRDAGGVGLKEMPAFHALRPSQHCGLVLAFRFLRARLAGDDRGDEAALSLGAMTALTAVFADGAEAVVAALDSGQLSAKAATLAGLHVLAAELLAKARAHQAQLLLAAANPDAEAPPVWRQVSA